MSEIELEEIFRAAEVAATAPEKLNPFALEMLRRRYRFLERVSTGRHSGVVLKALDALDGKQVAIRILRPREAAESVANLLAFSARLHPLAHLDHSAIAKVREVVDLGDSVFVIATEYVAGPSLAELIAEKGAFALDRTLATLEKIADALGYAHDRGVVRYHLFPKEILFPTPETPLLIRWGITVRSGVMVPFTFVAPEPPAAATPQADVYALGAIGYYMITGRPPFEADNTSALLRAKEQERYTSKHDGIRSFPKCFDDFVRKCLRAKPGDRYGSMQEVKAALAAITQETPCGQEARTDERRSLAGRLYSGELRSAFRCLFRSIRDCRRRPEVTRQ